MNKTCILHLRGKQYCLCVDSIKICAIKISFYADSVRLNRLTKGECNSEIEAVVKDWLRTALDCSGGRRQRDKLLLPQLPAQENLSESHDEAKM